MTHLSVPQGRNYSHRCFICLASRADISQTCISKAGEGNAPLERLLGTPREALRVNTIETLWVFRVSAILFGRGGHGGGGTKGWGRSKEAREVLLRESNVLERCGHPLVSAASITPLRAHAAHGWGHQKVYHYFQ